MKQQTFVLALLLGSSLMGSGLASAAPARPLIQVAILLDTSNSMDGLIDQAKTQLWKVVNDLAGARRSGVKPELQVALFEYGNNGLPAAEGWVRLVLPLTTDLDRVSEALFALRTNGGDEFCGTVIRDAASRLAWSAAPADYRAIFIAGNEPFTQGNVAYKESCRAAIAKGIVVNTIFCGDRNEGIRTSWKDGADLADGRYMNIDQNLKAAEIEAPQDAEIARLGAELNQTYVPFGTAGSAGKARQEAQDANALAAAPSALAERQVTKAGAGYTNAGWDLVDAQKQGMTKVEDLKTEDLPVEMRSMSEAERKAHVAKKAAQRDQLQAQIKKLSDERTSYIAAARKNQAAGTSTLDAALLDAVHQQVVKKGFVF